MERDKVENMLQLIQERLEHYTTEETVERLHSYGSLDPSIEEFSQGLKDEEE